MPTRSGPQYGDTFRRQQAARRSFAPHQPANTILLELAARQQELAHAEYNRSSDPNELGDLRFWFAGRATSGCYSVTSKVTSSSMGKPNGRLATPITDRTAIFSTPKTL
jgi:hypothetical protein